LLLLSSFLPFVLLWLLGLEQSAVLLFHIYESQVAGFEVQLVSLRDLGTLTFNKSFKISPNLFFANMEEPDQNIGAPRLGPFQSFNPRWSDLDRLLELLVIQGFLVKTQLLRSELKQFGEFSLLQILKDIGLTPFFVLF
jgi:hypothetical protein